LRHINPLPKSLGDTLRRYTHVAVAELNMGQLRKLLRAEYLLDIQGLNKIQGQPFKVSELIERVETYLDKPEVAA
jgi:2-oxoglutarate ferredoxin oxidoreductase subunit alpha